MQTMDMILIKKKRIALAKKNIPNEEGQRRSIWGVLASVGTNRANQESKLYCKG